MKKKTLFATLLCFLASAGVVVTTTSCKTDNPPVVEEEKFTVTFNSDGGTTVPAQSVEKGKKATEPTAPTKEGYTFDGWYNGSTKYNFNDAVTGNLTLTAHWTANASVDEGFTATLKYDNGAADGKLEATKTGENWFFAKPTDPEKANNTFDGWFTEAGVEFDFTKAVTADVVLVAHWTPNTPVEEGFTATLHYNNGEANGTLSAVKDGEKWYFNAPQQKPSKLYNEFAGWYSDEELKKPFDWETEITEDIDLYADWVQAYDTVRTPWNFLAGATIINPTPSGNVILTEDMLFQGKFTLGTGARFEIGSSNCINTQNKKFEFIFSEESTYNAVSFTAKWASSSAGGFTIVNTKTEEVVYEITNLTNGSASFDASVTDLPSGTYAVIATGSIRFYNFELTEKLPQGPISGLELDTSAIDQNVLLGRAFSTNGLSVKLAYENGRKDVVDLANVTVTPPADFTTAAGVKEINVFYVFNGTTYKQTYTVNVCDVEELVIYDYVLNSSRITLPLQTVFSLNGTFNSQNLVVKAKCLLPDSTTDYVEFLLLSDEFTLEKPNLTTVGNKDVVVTYKRDTTITKEYTIEVIAVPDLSAESEILVVVDPNSEISTSGNYNFHTINQALQFLELVHASENAVKTISLMKNTTYREKVEINMPNVVLTTGDLTEDELESGEGFSYEDTKDLFNLFAVIEFDALNGKLDPSETITHSTDGSATVSIRPDAENFSASFVTFKNYYNTNALYNESLTITKDSQAVACLVQADKALFIGCKFTSYHDTLYAQLGRQFYAQCLIEGHTDYIFGYNATAVFYYSIIRSIGAGADPEENGNYNNGGYVVATKGLNKADDTDGIEYGYVFNTCLFIADEATADGSVSIARGWDTNMRIMVMNSMLNAHISKEAYGEVTATEGSKNMNDRYGKMNADPNADFLLEYMNGGDGAIQESLPNTCTVVTPEVAEKFEDLNTVFNPVNRNMHYADTWIPMEEKNATVVLKDGNGNVVQTLENISYVNSVVTKSMLDEAFEVPADSIFGGYYSDQACTKDYDFSTVLSNENVIYVKLSSAAGVTYTTYTLEIPTDVSSWTEVTPLNEVFSIASDSSKPVKTESLKNGAVAYGDITFGPKQFSLTGGKAAKDFQSIKIVVANEANVTVYCGSKSDKTIQLSILDANGTAADYTNLKINDAAASAFATLSITEAADKYEFTLKAGTYYIGGTGGGCYIYGMTVEVKNS